jgi:hypothetical protein
MKALLKLIVDFTNNLHDILIATFSTFGFDFNDKQLHFIIVALIGMAIYLMCNYLFKILAKINIACISFVYTFTVLIVFVFAIEIQQKITKRGQMEFADITAGLWGFVFLFAIYLLIVALIYCIKKLFKYMTEK